MPQLPWYALRENYCAAVTRAGGLPVLLAHEVEQAEAYLRTIDGLVVTAEKVTVEEIKDPKSVKWASYIPPTARVRSTMRAAFNADGKLVAQGRMTKFQGT